MTTSSAVVIVVIIAVLLIIYIVQRKNKTQNKSESHDAFVDKLKEAQLYLDELYLSKKIKTIPTDIILKKGEEAYLSDEVSYFEMRSKSVSTRGGGAIRIAKGVYIGGSQGQSRSVNELRCIDQGTIILTNKRVLFNGAHTTKEYKIDKILKIETNTDAISIACEGKEKIPQFYGIDNVALWRALITLMKQFNDISDYPHILLTSQEADYEGENHIEQDQL